MQNKVIKLCSAVNIKILLKIYSTLRFVYDSEIYTAREIQKQNLN